MVNGEYVTIYFKLAWCLSPITILAEISIYQRGGDHLYKTYAYLQAYISVHVVEVKP